MEYFVFAVLLISFVCAHVYFEFFVKKEKVQNVDRGILIYISVSTCVLIGNIVLLAVV
ncbi:hypothetical protein JMA_38490 (plasmid) [Jeotgalibacillus malaysiensis]|uniref:Uncharacterized protein n=1 Tax=Jeotgalibacillus malaysiensis TaxID=1508404 RepID=A0A0B5AWU6_9BACL|nr:hypothetical protein JMA_38490 [Jeotgalibacillus malaysiensis]